MAKGEGDISGLPEGCLANILSFTSPRDACRSSSVSPMFKAAADSDFVWEKFLPSDYKEIIVNAAATHLKLNSKKELYFWLSDHPVFLDGGNKSLNIEKKSGKKCIMIGAKELRIVWGDTPMYWKWKSHPDSRFSQVAELKFVWWFEIVGKVDTRMLSPKTTYAVYFVIKFVPGAQGLADAPTEVSVQFVEGGGSASGARNVYLDPEDNQSPHPVERGDGWMEIELGEFYNGGEDGEVEMSLKEVAGHLKFGLIVEGIELRPKE